MGTWNVAGTFEEGKLRHLVNEVGKYKFDIVTLQETKQSGYEVMEVGDCVFLNSGGEKERLGTGFLINRELKELIVDFQPISERICLIRLRGKYQKITIITEDGEAGNNWWQEEKRKAEIEMVEGSKKRSGGSKNQRMERKSSK